jgi:hypothetical protein
MSTQWIYVTRPWVVLVTVFGLLFALSWLGHALGARVRDRTTARSAFYLADYFPSTIMGLLALILGFTFSMTISRFENRRQLVIAEANALGTAHLRAGLLRAFEKPAIQDRLRGYLDSRIRYYRTPYDPDARRELVTRQFTQQAEIWALAIRATRRDRGAIESIFASSLNLAFDVANERDIVLSKTLPPMIYWSLLLISSICVTSFGFIRGQKGERGQWQPSILVFVLSLVIYLILDIERPDVGSIRISQDAMLSLRDSWRSGDQLEQQLEQLPDRNLEQEERQKR